MTHLERDRIHFEEGLEEGMEKGMEKGIEKEKEKNAKALLDVLDDETISKKLEMPIERVKALRKEMMQS